MSNHLGSLPPAQDFEGRPLVGLMTTCYTPDSTRLPIAHETLDNYREAGIPVVVVDGSPEQEIRDGFQERGATVLYEPNLMLATSAQAGARFILASGGNTLVKHEPEKPDIPRYADRIASALRRVDGLVIGRTPRAMYGLPPTQRWTERIGGRLMTRHLGFPADSLSGGRGLTRDGIDALLNYDPEKWGDNWMHLHVPLLDLMADHRPVGGIRLPLRHPRTMKEEETGNPDFDRKRRMQLKLHGI